MTELAGLREWFSGRLSRSARRRFKNVDQGEDARQFARLFNAPGGEYVLLRLRQWTVESTAQDRSDAQLREAEGQRQLVKKIEGLIEQGLEGAKPVQGQSRGQNRGANTT